MQDSCEIYVDPEEDEVFFGCVSEREKNLCTKLVKYAVSSPKKDESKLSKILDECEVSNIEENIENISRNEQSTKISEEIFVNEPADLIVLQNEFNISVEKEQETGKILSKNTSVELENNFSSLMNQKIDKNILATPKSIVKADKDGGFLKILSEIALVKAEAEGNNTESRAEDEDKENKFTSAIPEIKIIEATPEKGAVLSSPKNIKTELRKFRNICNSPRNEDNIDHKSKSVDNLEMEKNFKNRCLNQNINRVFLDSDKKKSIDLIDFNDFESGILNVSILLDEDTGFQPKKEDDEIGKNSNNKMVVSEKQKHDCEILTLSESSIPSMDEKSETCLEFSSEIESQLSDLIPTTSNLSKNLRFSKEARKVVEVLKKSAVDDTLNFTIPEIDIEEENSFLCPKLVSVFDETVITKKKVEILAEKSYSEIAFKPDKLQSNSQRTDNKLATKTRTVEKDEHKLTPVISQSKLQPVKFFSERRIYNRNETETRKKCSKKLPMEEKKPATAEKLRGGKTCESNSVYPSRIPVFGLKNSKTPVNERVIRPLTVKTTLAKTPSGESCKNSKFNHIESPINAYIHNKPTSLVLNVKPELKKVSLTKVWKAQTMGSVNKIQEKTPPQKHKSTIKLPFVEYKSATPYKIEKQSESRLPRLAPTVKKLIGSHSPKVLKHEGRFYMSTPRKQSSSEATIVADPKEVSVVVSQYAQKSHTIK